MADVDWWLDPPLATVIHDCLLTYHERETSLKRAIGFKRTGKQVGMAANSDSIFSAGYKAYEGFAIVLQPSAVPVDLIVTGNLRELCKLRFAQAYGWNLVCFDLCFQLSSTLIHYFGTHASEAK
jgi:hypothetical protein